MSLSALARTDNIVILTTGVPRLEAARISQGLERLDQIKFAILERNGQISIIAQD